MSNLSVTDLAFEQCTATYSCDDKCASLRLKEETTLSMHLFNNMKMLERLSVRNIQIKLFLCERQQGIFVIIPVFTQGPRDQIKYEIGRQSLCQTILAIPFKEYVLDGYYFNNEIWGYLLEALTGHCRLQTIKLLNAGIESEDTVNLIKSSPEFKYQEWECIGHESYNITLKTNEL